MEQFEGEQQVMFDRFFTRRGLAVLFALALLGGCKVIPKSEPAPPPPPPEPTAPSAGVLPTDTERHRVALLVPLTGSNSAVGLSIANAATMALLDTNAQNLRVTTYDTSSGAAGAAQRAIADGNKLILGPLLSDNIPAVAQIARPAGVPMISFSNDATAAAQDVFIIGNLPSQSVARTVNYARSRGITNFAALVPSGEYGERAAEALTEAARAAGGSVVASEKYDRNNTSIISAATRLREKGGFGAVLIADGGRLSARAAPALKPSSSSLEPRIIGTELWSGERAITTSAALRGSWYAAVADNRFSQFAVSYNSRFGNQPYRIATLGYDAVLLSLRVARDWKPGTAFPTRMMLDKGGFLGLDGPFRFGRNGVIERALEVREVQTGTSSVVSPAPARFND